MDPLSRIFRMDSPLPYYVCLVVPLTMVLSHVLALPFLTLLTVFGGIPILDHFLGVDLQNPSPEQEKAMDKNWTFKVVLFAWVPLQTALLVWAAVQAVQVPMFTMPWWNLVTAAGFLGAEGINVAHELFHKLDGVNRWLGKLLLVTSCYGHFFVEHVWGHHKNVGTPMDTATAVTGQSLYAFLPQTLLGSVRSAWELERERLERLGQGVPHNQVLQLAVASACVAAALGWALGAPAVVFFLAQSAVSVFMLEIVNYIEHYGLRRREVAPGKYEPVNVTHSWNAPQRLTNFFLFKLQRHSDHHAHALREYQVLRSFDESPQMPTGYPGMMLLALVPPLWFMVMNPRVGRYYRPSAAAAVEPGAAHGAKQKAQ